MMLTQEGRVNYALLRPARDMTRAVKPMRLYSDMKAMTMLQAGVGPEADSRRTSLFGGVCVPLACMASKK